MSRPIKRCPECGSPDCRRRTGSIHGSHGDDDSRYRCGSCGWRGDRLEDSTTDRDRDPRAGLPAKLLELAEKHDGDVPIRGGSA
jgi:transposase-like protein